MATFFVKYSKLGINGRRFTSSGTFNSTSEKAIRKLLTESLSGMQPRVIEIKRMRD